MSSHRGLDISSEEIYIYGWSHGYPKGGNEIGSINLSRIGSDTILKSEF